MADRYWVGGTGNWTSINTANWSATSGGSGGASVPTTSDKVYIDSNSGPAGAVITVPTFEIANCYSFTKTVNIALAGVFGYLNVGNTSGGANCGDYQDSGVSQTSIREIRFYGTTSGTPSVFSSTPSFASTSFFINQGSVDLGSNINSGTGIFYVTAGTTLDVTFRTVTCGFSIAGGATLVPTFATLTCFFWAIGSTASVATNNISSLTITGTSNTFSENRAGTQVYTNVTFGFFSNTTPTVISTVGNLTFNSVTLTGGGISVPGGRQLSFNSFTVTQLSPNAVLTTPNPASTRFAISQVTGTALLNGLIISGCNATGGATFIAGASSVDGGFNSGIQFVNSRGLLPMFT
jgi:hypothetical protein